MGFFKLIKSLFPGSDKTEEVKEKSAPVVVEEKLEVVVVPVETVVETVVETPVVEEKVEEIHPVQVNGTQNTVQKVEEFTKVEEPLSVESKEEPKKTSKEIKAKIKKSVDPKNEVKTEVKTVSKTDTQPTKKPDVKKKKSRSKK